MRRTIRNKIEDLEQTANTENGVTIVPLDESGEVRGSPLDNNSAAIQIQISISDETYETWD